MNFDMVLKVFNLFELTCHVETSPVEEHDDFFSTTSRTSATPDTASVSTKTVDE